MSSKLSRPELLTLVRVAECPECPRICSVRRRDAGRLSCFGFYSPPTCTIPTRRQPAERTRPNRKCRLRLTPRPLRKPIHEPYEDTKSCSSRRTISTGHGANRAISPTVACERIELMSCSACAHSTIKSAFCSRRCERERRPTNSTGRCFIANRRRRDWS